jgi:hypothetical protein
MAESEHSSALIRAFIAPERQERYLGLLTSSRGRDKLRARLAHLRDLDQRFVSSPPSDEQTPSRLAALLRARGAPEECVLLAEDAALDGRRLPLAEALSRVVGRGMGAFLSCIPGRLAFYEGEEPGQRYILERAT